MYSVTTSLVARVSSATSLASGLTSPTIAVHDHAAVLYIDSKSARARTYYNL
jgi:hypothetical protein